jgi:uncharacterized protein (UPF0333 family)
MKKGQVSTEYLVILAVVLVIALVVVFLVSQGTQVGAGVTETQSKNYWAAQTPLSIVNYQATATAIQVEMTNRDAEDITVTSIEVDGTERYSTATTFNPGETQTITLTFATGCTAGGRFSFDIDSEYSRGALTALRQNGERDIVGSCS